VKRVAIVLHGSRAAAAEIGRALVNDLAQRRVEVVALPEDAERLGAPAVATPAARLADDVDLVFVLGGDGTLLRAASLVRGTGTPLLGVNLGRLGFLAHIEREQLSSALEKILAEGFEVEERMTLEGEVVSGDQIVEELWALNDVIVEKLSPGRLIKLAVAIDGEPFTSFGCDGLIVATPTGSTAYSFSAHGPVVAPNLDCLVLTPVSAHGLFDRSIVVGPHDTIAISIVPNPDAVSLVIDGRKSLELTPEMEVRVRAGKTRARLARVDATPFWSIVRTKFGMRGELS
jgi:NAD+ kinase